MRRERGTRISATRGGRDSGAGAGDEESGATRRERGTPGSGGQCTPWIQKIYKRLREEEREVVPSWKLEAEQAGAGWHGCG